ncbi:hypothetical protein MTR_6g081130 [Medicago truncatula]|uniref:Uncharacterized protein n=2 Tax=Medicago truncatula TaxID=3880 RepID=G7KM32_MEDTR|nr:hypothetical protein MTR_6g081130 [Medicago truncatula]
MENFQCIAGKKGTKSSQEPQPMSTTPTKKSEAKAEATSKGHDAAQAKAEVPQTHLATLPPKIESQPTSRGESSSKELATKQSGYFILDYVGCFQELLSCSSFIISLYLEHLFTKEQ